VPDHKKLRCVLLCNSVVFRQWQVSCIDQMADKAEVVLLVVNDNPSEKNGLWTKLYHYPYRNLLYRAYTRYCVHLRSQELVGMELKFNDVPVIRCKTVLKGKYSQYFSDQDIKTIKSYSPDFILRFGFNIIKGDILDAAPYGVWSYHHSDEEYYRGGPPVFWEIFHGDPVSGAILQRLTGKVDAGIVLRKGYFKTILHSYRETLDTLLSESSRWVGQVCGDLIQGNDAVFQQQPSGSSAKMNKYPGNRQTVLFLLRLSAHKIWFHFSDLFMAESWKTGIAEAPVEKILSDGFPGTIHWMQSDDRECYYADPFVFETGGKVHILFENYSYRHAKAKISEVVLNEEYNFKISNGVFPGKFHRSYPFVIQVLGDIYCLPECCEGGSAVLYRYDNKASQWVEVAVVVNEPLVDPSMFYYHGKWWLFCTKKGQYTNMNLFIYHADDITGPYTSHTGNPVKTDIRSSRSAGNIFEVNGKIYRPSQDCSETYGGKIRLNEITVLSETEFREKQAAIITSPDRQFRKGIHTLSSVNGITVFDTKRYFFSFSNFKRKLFTKMRISLFNTGLE